MDENQAKATAGGRTQARRPAALRRPQRGRASSVLILCAALAGCASYVPRPIAPGATLRAYQARTLADPALCRQVRAQLPGTPSGCTSWDLASLTVAAEYFSPGLGVARARRGVAAAAVTTAAERPNPVLLVPFGITTNPKPGESPHTFGLGLDISIETAGKRGDRIARAEQRDRAARFELGAAVWRLRSRMRRQLLALHVARREAALRAQQVRAREQLLALLDRRLAAGEASAPERGQARADLARARIALAQVRLHARDALAGAAATVGLPLAALADATIRLDAFERLPPPLPAAAVRNAALRHRAEVRAALAEYEARQAELELEVARQVPDLHLGSAYTYDAGAHKVSFSLAGIPIPLLNRHQGPIAEARARRKLAAAQFEAVVAQSVAQADRAVAQYGSTQALVLAATEELVARRSLLQAARQAFEAGETGRLDPIRAELSASAADLAREQALAQLQQAAGEVEDAMQSPWPGAPTGTLAELRR
jgi:outer membrane protein, heavy metal efflux system